DQINALPDDPDLYSTIFLILGTNNQGSHSLNTDEALFFSSYLNNGGKLYLESYSFWYYSDSTYLHHYLKYASQKVSPYLFDSIFGKQATFSEGMKYRFNGPIHYAPFAIEPVNPAYCLFSNNLNPDRCLQIAYDGDDYKTIGTLVEFGQLIDALPPSTKENLMLKYLDFFRINTDGPYPLFHAEERNICKGQTVSFLDDSYDNVSSWSWEFPGGSPATSGDANPVVLYANPGDYDISLTVSDGTESWTLNRKAYIHVDECSGIVEKHRGTELKVFPNPADDEINVLVNSRKPENANLRITDLQGRTVLSMEVSLSGKKDWIVLPVSNLLSGLYLVSLHSSEGVIYQKVVVK
ncbi:MAG: T9SS type A sorting domain-containing protein, partial [Bacteroidetes bacterium]|nr:T9SS type A sorting domain-containing protein [Bacteroidota bacterium]